MDVRTEMLVFQDFEGLTEVFAPGRPPGYPRGRPQDIRPQNLLFGLIFRSSTLGEELISGPEKGVITKGVFSREESLESLKTLNSLESLENGRILLCFPQSGSSLESLESLSSLESPEKLKGTFLKRPLFQKTPFSEPDHLNGGNTRHRV